MKKVSTVFSLNGEISLITGGGSGLGLGIARCMSASGARVVLVGRTESTLKKAASEIGKDAFYEVHDVTTLDESVKLIQRIEDRVGPVSILVNNAGVHLKKSALETTDDEFQHVLQTHVNGAFALTRESARGMIKRRKGSILFIASMASYLAVPKVVAYSAAKSAYIGMVRALASEFSPHNVRVNAIAPGFIKSRMLDQALKGDPARKAKILGRTPMARFGDPEEIGWASVYLSSEAGKFITGTILPVDGGAHVGF